MYTNLESNALYQIMNHNNIWSGVTYTVAVDDVLVEAYIPQNALTKSHRIPRRILNWIERPCAENRMKLIINGVRVKYTYAEPSGSIMGEVA